MSTMILGRTLRGALMSGLLVGLSAMAVYAAPATPQPGPAGIDRGADQSASTDLHKAMAALAKHDRRASRDFLERADTVLLNREVLDLGPSLRVDQPLPETPLRQDIEQAKTAMRGPAHDANGAIKRAVAAVDAELAPSHKS